MPAAKCAICGKTAYPLESITAVEKTYHKACFKCAVCRLQLNLSNYKGLEGKVYCSKHVPKATATAVVDTVAMQSAKAAPKRTAESLGTVQKGTGDRATAVVDSVAMQNVKAAPKRTAEGLGTVQKGTGGKPTTVVFGADGGSYEPEAQHVDAGYAYQGQEQPQEGGEYYEEQQPQEGEEYYEEQQPQEGEEYYEEQPQEGEEYYEEQPQEGEYYEENQY